MDLFSSYRLGAMALPNRIVMAPMTRSRAADGVPSDLVVEYYAQRSSAGLIVTEGIAPSPNGLGYARIPALYSREQIAAWRRITDRVHATGGRIVAQIMHTGRAAHPLNMPPGTRILAPSAVAANGMMYTDQQGPLPHPVPEAMTLGDITAARVELVQAARNAIEAGFDGIELHAANGYLLEQFLHPHTNRRSDAYGGSVERRNRFVIEVAEASALAVGAERVGIRISPHSTLLDLPAYEGVAAQYERLARALRGLVYLHVPANAHPEFEATVRIVRAAFAGPLIKNGGFERASAERALATGDADLIAFGRPFIANPDLVERLRAGVGLAEPDASAFFTPGPAGYVDYPYAA